MMGLLRRRTSEILHSFGTTVNVVPALIVFIFIVVSLYNSRLVDEVDDRYDSINSQYYNVARLKEAAQACDLSINEYLRTENRITLAEFNESAGTFWMVLDELRSVQSNLETLYLIRSIQDSFDTYFSTCSLACFKYIDGDYTYYTYMYEAQRINDYLIKYSDELLALLMEEGRGAHRQMQEMQAIMLATNRVAIVISLVLFGMCIVYINFRATRPLGRLVAAVRNMSRGNFDTVVETKGPHDTIWELSEAFNMMSSSIRTMMDGMREKAQTERNLLLEKQKNVDYQRMLSQANFLALQAQINPHFLFNTLNSISRTITLDLPEHAVSMIDSMVALLRYNLTDAGEPILLRHELKITREYLGIQKYRFLDRIQVKICCPDTLADNVMMPRFIMQPLVENAIIHGVELLETGGAIKIKVQLRRGKCVIKIIDNGMGIPDEIMREMKRGESPATHTGSIGIQNTRDRLYSFTEDKDSFSIRSKRGLGTVVTVTLKQEGEGSHV